VNSTTHNLAVNEPLFQYNSDGGTVTEPRRPTRLPEDREIDYLICSQCNTPCYIFEMSEGRVAEAQCLVCGNDAPGMFVIGEEAGSEQED
jgi:hypothetical protein